MSQNQPLNPPSNENDWDEEEDLNLLQNPLNQKIEQNLDDERKMENYTLWTLIELFRRANIVINGYSDAVFNDNIPKFVMHFFNITSIENVQISQNTSNNQQLSKQQIQNINAVIKFLTKKEIKFNILDLRFTDIDTTEASSVMFYSTFLNLFFVKVPRKQLYERCGTILYSNETKFEDYEHFVELTSYTTFFRLVNFLKTNCTSLDSSFQFTDQMFQQFLGSINIPMVLNLEVLEKCKEGKILDAVFYQLQFIFDSLDEQKVGPNNQHFHAHIGQFIKENYYSFLKSLRKINIMKPKEINDSMKVKRNVINLQKTKSESYISKSSGSSRVFDIQTEDSNFEISTYNKRHGIADNKQNDEIEVVDQTINLSDVEKFWNKNAGKLGFDQGIPFDLVTSETVKKQIESQWNSEIMKLPKYEEQSRQEEQPASEQINIYKLFVYNEVAKIWTVNQNELRSFQQILKYDRNALTPLVLFMNSYENDSKSVISQLISGSFPDLNDQIFVYAIRNKNFSQIIDYSFSNLNFSNKVPVFLLLHVPKSMETMPNISTIIIQIYSFLSMFVDFEVVVLNNNRFSDQLEMTKLITKIANSYEKENALIIQKKKSKVFQMEEFNINTLPFVFKKGNIIFLYELAGSNSETDQLITSNQFFKNITTIDGKESEIHLIDSKNLNSYGSFLSYLAKSLENGTNQLMTITKNFSFVDQYTVSDFFIYIMRQKEAWKDELIKSINMRLNELKSKKDKKENEVSLLLKLGKEISSISPPFAIDFNNECNLILSGLKENLSKSKRSIIESEIRISAKSHIEFLEREVKKKPYWTKRQINIIKNGHSSFINKEFLDIIKGITTDKAYNMVYEDNIDIADKQFESDEKDLANIFKKYEENLELQKKIIKQNILENTDKSLNYTMRETEHLREIKIVIESDEDFESKIPQDF